MTASKFAQPPDTHWVVDKRYNYSMTMVAGLLAKDGIVAISDGRVVDDKKNIHTDVQNKVYDISPQCVAMPAGGVAPNMNYLMSVIKHYFTTTGKWGYSTVVREFISELNQASNV